jgi:hypothetical protein
LNQYSVRPLHQCSEEEGCHEELQHAALLCSSEAADRWMSSLAYR